MWAKSKPYGDLKAAQVFHKRKQSAFVVVCALQEDGQGQLLYQVVRADRTEKSRLDLVVRDPVHSALLDGVVFYPVQPCGRKLYRHGVLERMKYDRYQRDCRR